MKQALLKAARHLHRMEEEAVGAVVRKDYRNTELAKIISERKLSIETAVKNLSDTRAGFIDSYLPHPKDGPEHHARRLRLADEMAAMPAKELIKMDVSQLDYEAQTIRAASLRKRGMHDESDQAYYLMKQQQEAWRSDPLVRGIEKEITKLSMLKPALSGGSLFIGDIKGDITKDDFATVRDDGTIVFKDPASGEVIAL